MGIILCIIAVVAAVIIATYLLRKGNIKKVHTIESSFDKLNI